MTRLSLLANTHLIDEAIEPLESRADFNFAPITSHHAPGSDAARSDSQSVDLKTDWSVVVGRVGLQNSLLCKTLSSELNIACELVSDLETVGKMPGVHLQLLDAELLGLDSVVRYVDILSDADDSACVAVFNLTQENNAALQEQYFGWPVLQGVFIQDCDPALLVDGVRSILRGQLSLPRAYLTGFVKRHRIPSDSDRTAARAALTRKERQVLKVMIEGCTNIEIGKQLSISPHTVKTHIYNLYKKLSVNNRVEAVVWGRRFLQMTETN